MKISEIFKSIDGEGKRAGMITTFIRTYGCNMRCSWCDSMYAVDVPGAYTELSVEQILEEVEQLGAKCITVTGGEPLLQEDMKELLTELSENGYDVNVETNGSVLPDYYETIPKVWYTIDYKLPSSGMESLMNDALFRDVCDEDVVKFVVGSEEDLERALEILDKYRFTCAVYFSPVFGFKGSDIVDFMIEHDLYDCKVQLQLHKYIWEPDRRGV